MNTSNTSAPWVPYKIPATPPVEAGQIYALSAKEGADPSKNPSQFLEWKEILPKGINNDMLKWSGNKWVPFSPSGTSKNPSALQYNGSDLFWNSVLPNGSENDILRYDGEKWVVLSPSGSEEEPYFLKYDGSELSWGPSNLPKGSNKGDLLYWDTSAENGGAWAILSAPSDDGAIIYWNGEGWSFLSPPSGSGLKVLTANEGTLAWTDTQDC